ncbi:MAG: glycosyltransferase [Candidatus Hydrogenedentota bacterium]
MQSTSQKDSRPAVSVIIPSSDGYRDGCMPGLLESVAAQTYTDFEICMVKGIFPQGKAINQGADQAVGDILIVLDDDSRLADEHVFETLVQILKEDKSIGMAGASIVTPPESSRFQQKAAGEFPRFNTPVVDVVTDSDFACHGCCAMRVEVFNSVGREREDIVRGLDPDLRVRLREAGYRVVLAPNTRIYHPLPDGWRKLLKIFFRNGKGAAYAQRFQPETVYETHESLHENNFQPRMTPGYRIARYPLRLLMALASGKFMRFAAYCSYALGYGWGWCTNRRIVMEESESSERCDES